MKIALVKVPATYATWYKRPAIGLCYLVSVLEKQDINVQIFDAYYNAWSTDQLVSHLVNYKPDLVGATAMTHEVSTASAIVSQVKERINCKAVIGGPHVTALPKRTLREFPSFDFGIYGEGEKTLVDLVKKIKEKDGNKFYDIEGLVFRTHNGEICQNPPRPFLTTDKFNALPIPAFHQYYGSNPNALSAKDDVYIMMSSRGCPYKCSFCMRVLGNKIRRRSPENIIQEIKYAVSQYAAHTIDFIDEIFLSNTSHTHKVLQMIIDEGLNQYIRWQGLTRANFVNEELIALAKESGCFCLHFGVESGNDEILNLTKKSITVAQIQRAAEIIKKAGIYLVTYYILGHPGETYDTIHDTIKLAAKLNTDHIAVGIMTPYPGTQIYEMALSGQMGYKLLSEDWSHFDKYGGKALEIEGLPYNELIRLQKKAYLNFYLKNRRFKDLFRFSWARRSAFFYFSKQKISKLFLTRFNKE